MHPKLLGQIGGEKLWEFYGLIACLVFQFWQTFQNRNLLAISLFLRFWLSGALTGFPQGRVDRISDLVLCSEFAILDGNQPDLTVTFAPLGNIFYFKTDFRGPYALSSTGATSWR